MKKLICFLFSLFIFTNVICAESVSLSGDSKVEAGGTFTVTMKGNTQEIDCSSKEDNIDNFKKCIFVVNGTINYDKTKLELVSQKAGTGFDNILIGTKISVDGLIGHSGTFTVATLTFKAKSGFIAGDSTEISVGSVKLSNGNYQDISAGGATHTVSVKIPPSTVNTLSTLKIDNTEVSDFNSSTTSYTLSNVTKSSVNITASPTDSKATISGTGTKTLSYGDNTFNIVVTSESGAKKTYTIKINRLDTRDKNNYLSNITLSEGSLSFNKETTSYKVNVGNKVNSVTINATTEKTTSTVTGTGVKIIKYGDNTYKLVVTAENGSQKTYTIVITKVDDRNTNKNLSTLTLSEGSISFNKNTTTYKVIVDHDVNSLTISATPEATTSTVTGVGTKTLKDYSNSFTITVTAENQTKKTYTIIVIRKDKDGNTGKLSTDNTLSKLSIKNYSINFNSKTTEYSIDVENTVTEISVSATANDKKATLEIDANEVSKNLQVGENKIIVKVTSESGESKEYTIKVNRKADEGIVSLDTLEEALKSSTKNTLEVEIKDDNNKLSESVIKALQESNKTIIIKKYDNEKLLYSWTLKGSFDSNKEFNSLIEFTESSTLLNKTNYSEGIYLDFSYEGNLPKGTILKIYVGDKYKDGEKLSLYYFNKEKIDLVKKDIEVKDKYVSYELDHCSQYVLTRANLITESTPVETETSTNIPLIIISIIEGIAVIVFIILLLKKKNNNDNKKEKVSEDDKKETKNVEEKKRIEEPTLTPVVESNIVTTEFTNDNQVEFNFTSSESEPVVESKVVNTPVVESNTSGINNDSSVEFNFTSSNNDNSFSSLQNEFKYNAPVETAKPVKQETRSKSNTSSNDIMSVEEAIRALEGMKPIVDISSEK